MAQRDVEAFERLMLPHLDDAYGLACHLLGNEHDAQDVVQDAVLRALRYFDGYGEGDPRAWLLAIVRNCCHSWHRQHRADRLSVSYSDAADSPNLHRTPEADTHAIQSSERAAIGRAVAELPAEFREVIVLREIQEMSYKEISTVVGVPIGTVMSRLARARKRLTVSLGLSVREAS
ncbi:MAG TPA: sigma-70 family RNA polymerase sigma factor [Gemmatimonadaceae bacterium]|jgi:RNA polymerase sigma-70 factor (ECF subfamily)|nr:sigma-70 family RNA polymerase sigma factor [Gemmatimonadaceae bacterium]